MASVRYGMSKNSTTASENEATDTANAAMTESAENTANQNAETQVATSPTGLASCGRIAAGARVGLATSVVLVGVVLSVGYFFFSGEEAPPPAAPVRSAEEQFDEQLAELQKSNEIAARIDSFTIDDLMLQKLAAIDRLTTIQVEADSVSLETIVAIAKMPKLEQLHIRKAAINDEMFAALAESPTIWLLNFPDARVSPAGIEGLAKMPSLRQLRLGIQGGDNRHGRAVATLSGLRAVHLIRIAVTDEGLHSLAKMPHLESLYLDDSSITDAGWTWLLEKSPQLHVHVNQKHHDRDPQSH